MAKVSPLDGVRVVELTSWMAAPGAGAVLADMGADVIKVEPITGDIARGINRRARLHPDSPDIDASFTVDNRGKRSITVAIDQPDGAQIVRRLVASADVLLCNLLPSRQQRYGLDAESLFEVKPNLVHATLTGYGLNGPDASRPGYDVMAFFGRGAITERLTMPGQPALQPGSAQGDHTTSLAMVAAILAALRVVERTGEGQVVDVNLMHTATWTMAADLSSVLIDGHQPTKRVRDRRLAVIATAFRCSDDRYLILNMLEPRWWRPFCETLGHPEWVDDERFATPRARFDSMAEITRLIDESFATRTAEEWGKILDAAGMIWGPAVTLAELANDEQAAAAGVYAEIEAIEGTFRTVAVPMHVSGADIRPRGPAPTLGQHALEVLREAGYTDDEIRALDDARTVRLDPGESF
jgi:crotonobetainyl-CoA:carnitine CoA-transferase CaiB-like acyl-CoA transferase